MAFMVIFVQNGGLLLFHPVFKSDVEPVELHNSFKILVRDDPCTESSQYFVKYKRNKTSYNHTFRNEDNANMMRVPSLSDTKIEPCTSFVDHSMREFKSSMSQKDDEEKYYLNVKFKINAQLRADVAICSFRELATSRHFRRGYVKFMLSKFGLIDMRKTVCHCEEVLKEHQINLLLLIEVILVPCLVNICFSWCDKLEGLVKKRAILEKTMSWLSTLGGSYSSLGDYFLHFSEKAGTTSIVQLRVAMEMGDPIMASKCRLFYALSCIQKGFLQYSKRLIRKEYVFAMQLEIRDQKLINMCRGIWSKLQYLHSKHRKKKLTTNCTQELLVT